VPISIRKRGGPKLVLAPNGTNVTTVPVRRHIDSAMVKAIAQAFRWWEMLENGTYATIAEIAAAEKINETYVGRVLRLTLLSPDIVEAILGGRQPAEMTLAGLMRRFAVGWREQRRICWGDCNVPKPAYSPADTFHIILHGENARGEAR
jgi:hypothetical protein